jgi:queuine tRNA-ribosyltransferase accessory subunit
MSYPSSYALKEFVSAHKGLMTIVGPKRIPPVECPNHNTETSITISTSVGFRSLKVEDYIGYLLSIRPDVVIGLADNPPHPGVKRREKMADRTCSWTTDMLEDLCVRPSPGLKPPSILAPILPIDYHQQSMYLDTLVEKYEPYIGGMALYSPSSVSAVPNHFEDHPFFLFDSPANPHLLLAYIALGIDIFTIPFINECTEQGIALTFSFPTPPSKIPGAHPLGMDLRYIPYATEDKPLVQGCECYTCQKHHRAYIHHLLDAKEMLGWTLLQIHNTHVMEQFFARVRESILLETFDKDLETFGRRYETDLPKGTVGLPTKRGYQMKSERNSKRQPKSYNKLEDTVGGATIAGEGDSDPTPPEPTMFTMSSPEDNRDDANAEVEIVDEMTLKSKMFRRMRVEAEETHGEKTGKDEVEDGKALGDTWIGEEGETMKHLFASHP